MTSIHNLNPNIVLISKLLAGPVQVYENALTQSDIQWIKDKEKYLQSSYTIEKQANVKNINVDKQLWNFITTKVNLSSILKTGGNYFKTTTPFVIHTDTPHEKDIIPFKNILIPLTIGGGNCYTIFLKQRHYGVGAHFLKSKRYKEFTPDKNIKITDYTDLEHYTNKNFDKNIYTEYLSHMPYDNLHGLSLETIIEWQIGDIIMFDATQLHCSNNFIDQTEEKHALSLFTNLGTLV